MKIKKELWRLFFFSEQMCNMLEITLEKIIILIAIGSACAIFLLTFYSLWKK